MLAVSTELAQSGLKLGGAAPGPEVPGEAAQAAGPGPGPGKQPR